MQLTVLVDNNTLVDRYFFAEPGLSLLIEDEDIRVLFDTGYSDIFLKNATKAGKNLNNLDYLVLSHNHLDHTWGLDPFLKYLTELQIENQNHKSPTLVAHPEIFTSVSADGFNEFGPLVSKEKMEKHLPLQLSRLPVALSSRLTFLGEIPRKNDFEGSLSFGRKEDTTTNDHVPDDSALVYKLDTGLVIITGCSHAGICNIIEYAKEICADNRIVDVIGGFHLQNPSKHQLDGTIAYFKTLQAQKLHACHCTDLQSKIALAAVVDIEEVGVGLSLIYT